jgi:predicted Abi (CAAX) family protease
MNTFSTQDDIYRPIAPWTGRLILPQPSQRRSDGGVYLHIENAPHPYADLKGQQVWLRWHPKSIHQSWLAKATIDIRFDEHTEKSQAKGNLHPTRLNGWQRVSPLESLAGARPQDDVQVELDVLSIDRGGSEWAISIDDEPIQIEGVLRGLVQFIAPVGDKQYRVRHYNRQSQKFDGVEAIASLPDAGSLHPQYQIEQSSIQNIEKSSLNASGWYIYGQFDPSREGGDRPFIVQALEPAEALRLRPEYMVIGRAETQQQMGEQKWKRMPFRRIDITLVDNNGKAVPLEQRTATLREKRTKELWQRSDEALVIHTFGWRGGSRSKKPSIVTGHFSFGFAKLVPDEFTGALRFSLIYRQVYAHSPLGIISGASRWHAYMGSLKYGWMYTLPVSDVMVRLPELTVPYTIGNQTFNPLNLIKQELALMEARYRSGNGNGASIVTPATSCVKDSNQALFAAITKFRDTVVRDPAVQTWMDKNPDNFHVKRFWGLRSLLELVEEDVLFPLGYVPKNWRGENDDVAVYDRDRANFATIIEVLKTWRTMLPRRAERELLGVFREYAFI